MELFNYLEESLKLLDYKVLILAHINGIMCFYMKRFFAVKESRSLGRAYRQTPIHGILFQDQLPVIITIQKSPFNYAPILREMFKKDQKYIKMSYQLSKLNKREKEKKNTQVTSIDQFFYLKQKS